MQENKFIVNKNYPEGHNSDLLAPLSIYVHWPFCISKCPYCDFNSHVPGRQIDQSDFLECYIKEINFFKNEIEGRNIKSIFFGGGTPSLMQPDLVRSILLHISTIGIITDDTEITLEANPTSYEAEKFHDFKIAGINRVSIGIQSLRDDTLKFLGRGHSAIEGKNALKSAAEIFSNISCDLIYAVAGQTQDSWRSELDEALEITKNHISLYQLTIEKGTKFYSLRRANLLKIMENDLASKIYSFTVEHLKKAGYVQYEISNFATDFKYQSQHNLCYWRYNEYLGIGPGAHSRLRKQGGGKIRKIMMTHKPQKWLDTVQNLGCGIQQDIILDPKDAIVELLMMGTRIKEGVKISDIEKISGKNFKEILDIKSLREYNDIGLIEFDDSSIAFTEKGMVLHSYLLSRLII